MKTVSQSYARDHYAEILDSVLEDREEIIIESVGRSAAVVVALAEYESLRETLHILREPANSRRVLASIKRLESGSSASSSDC
ncbi:prevent-host-death family protein [Sanguibacter keddieii DSM 10542]|uniref:Antitoxin n=1 Tax=Sanguibacter keddieii (strain ATCC 51767 / DSM 10542 / NCFB 3025 / ST-74) TaxID=446469 RepID=D1BF59_SANKS|nr:type II toxin-antitoxin system prevent-host-death family antitoxin [Sanguibacter keddieii]ACZ21355.1 prevent-host-death family protein [Sanguibacter keddieii DSM 10542]